MGKNGFWVGLVEIEEGELTGQQLNLRSHAIARISFAKEPHVKEVLNRSIAFS